MMKKVLSIFVLIMFAAIAASAQMEMKAAKATDADKNAEIPTNAYLKRGAAIGNSTKISLNKALERPADFAGKPVLVEGVVVRSCKTEGCWAEVAENKDSKSVRVKMKDHSFFIPLQSAGAMARVEGTLSVKHLSKDEVEHMIKDDGAKFPTRNADGSVTEVSFEATGIELRRNK